MKTRYIILAIAILAATACAKEASRSAGGLQTVTITATIEDAAGTKTAVQDGGTQVFWEPGDNIKVFYGGIGSSFASQCTGLSKVSDFVGSMSVIGGANEGAEPEKYIWGLYPYRVDAVSDGASVTTTLPSSQAAREGTFAQNTNITLARSEDLGLAFYNVCGGLRFSLTQEGIQRVVLEGNNGELLAGTVRLAFEGGVPVVKEITDGATSITLKAPDGGSFKTGVWYYIVSLPASLSGGFKLTLRKEAESAVIKSTGAVSIRRGVFGSLASVDSGVDFVSGSGGGPDAVSITIDGDFWDWMDVTDGLGSTKSTPVYHSFKVFNDSQYIYFYSKRDNRSAIWGVRQGYFYYDIDSDNDSSTGAMSDSIIGLETYMHIYPFAGTASAPAFSTVNEGDSYPSKDVLKSVIFAGAFTDTTVELEVRLPLAQAGIKKGDTVAIYSWGNKDASDFKSKPLVYTVK